METEDKRVIQIELNLEGTGLPFYKGLPSNCPPLPRIGESLMAQFGKAVVTAVTHYPDDVPYNIVIQLMNDRQKV